MTNALIGVLRERLAEQADPVRAADQQRYMKSALPYYGLTSAQVRRISRTIWDEHQLATAAEWRQTVLRVWASATHREEWYAAIALLRHRRYRAWATEPEHLDTLKHLVISGAWWDVVDEIATHCVGAVLRAHPDEVAPVMRGWAFETNLWVRRSAILSQLTFGEATDPDLLVDCLRPSLPDRDFFARKAIGWALRQYARTDPAWVRAYVAEHRHELSPLSIREALKHLG